MSKTNLRPGSASTTRPNVNHRTTPTRLCPTNRAPTTAPASTTAPAPEDQVTRVHSGLHSLIRGRSLTSAYTSPADASTAIDSVRSAIGLSLALGPHPAS